MQIIEFWLRVNRGAAIVYDFPWLRLKWQKWWKSLCEHLKSRILLLFYIRSFPPSTEQKKNRRVISELCVSRTPPLSLLQRTTLAMEGASSEHFHESGVSFMIYCYFSIYTTQHTLVTTQVYALWNFSSSPAIRFVLSQAAQATVHLAGDALHRRCVFDLASAILIAVISSTARSHEHVARVLHRCTWTSIAWWAFIWACRAAIWSINHD